MIGLRYNDEYLDILPNTTLTFEFQNLLFSGSDSSKLPGSYSFPFSLPATQHNRRILQYPERVDNALPFVRELDVDILFQGKVFFSGTLKVQEANSTAYKVYIVVNPVTALKDRRMNELDLGGVREIGNSATMLAHAKTTAQNPLDYDYVFFPVVNDEFLTTATGNKKSLLQNFYNVSSQAFEVADDYPALMPFARVEYLLEQMMLETGLQFKNEFQTDDELRALCVYNNYSLYAGGLATSINLQNHVSKTKASEWLRKLMSDFCLGLFYNHFNRTLRLIPIRDLLGKVAKYDWTDRALSDVTIITGTRGPETFDYKQDGGDAAFEAFFKGKEPLITVVAEFDTFYDLLSDGTYSFIDGLYYIRCAGGYYYYYQALPASPFFFAGALLGPAPELTGDVYECLLPPFFDFWHYGGIGTVLHADAPNGCMPQCRIPGTVTYTPTGGDEVVQSADTPDRLMLYRGMQYDKDAAYYPLACSTVWSSYLNTQVGEYSLRLQDSNGIYATWWKAWHTLLRDGKNVTTRLHLSVPDIINFDFEDKVRIGNQEYMVKRLRISISGRGMAPVEADMVSVF